MPRYNQELDQWLCAACTRMRGQNVWKPLSEFYLSRAHAVLGELRPSSSYCKSCTKAMTRGAQQDKRDRLKERREKWLTETAAKLAALIFADDQELWLVRNCNVPQVQELFRSGAIDFDVASAAIKFLDGKEAPIDP